MTFGEAESNRAVCYSQSLLFEQRYFTKSLATHLRCGMSNKDFIANILVSLRVKEF